MSSPLFVFDRYECADKTLNFHYQYHNDQGEVIKTFTEKLIVNFEIDPTNTTQAFVLKHLHIAIGTSYYKSLLGDVKLPYELTESEADFWNTIYDNGLGELAYVNKISAPIRPFSGANNDEQEAVEIETNGVILGIGGGKDSAVGGELFKDLGLPTRSFHMGTKAHQGQAAEVIKLLGFDELSVERYLDVSISSFTNEQNGYHGHIPLSAILAWIGVLAAVATKTRYVCMANESASSVGNVEWNGKMINHQWSKSYEFESLMQSFVQNHVSPNVWFFSPIRPYSSLAVVKLFAKLTPDYQLQFTSCNLVLRIDPNARPNNRWCGACAKCLSSWLLLSAYLDFGQLQEIFGEDLFEKTELKPMLQELLGLEGHKPLDCVGTTEELRAAARKALADHSQTALLSDITAEQIPGLSLQELENTLGPDNFPPDLRETILQTIKNKLG